MQIPTIAFMYALLRLLATMLVSANTIVVDDGVTDWIETGPRALKAESMLMGIAKSLIHKKKGTGGGQNQYCIDRDVYQRSARGFCKLSSLTTLSSPCKFFKMANGFCDLPDILSLGLNMSNIVLMLVLRGLIWRVSYMQNSGGGKALRNDGGATSAAVGTFVRDAFIEADAMLFLGYLVADQSGQYECLSLVSCEHPLQADNYYRNAEIVWKTVNLLNGVLPKMDAKYEKMLTKMREAINYGRMDGDCQSRYKCLGKTTTTDDRLN